LIKPILEGCKVLVCRPEPSASALAHVLSSVGASVEKLPGIDIVPLALSGVEKDHILNLDQFDHVIVISQHAAEIGISHIDQYWPQFPSNQKWHAIGRQTARSLPDELPSLNTPSADLTSEELLEDSDFSKLKNKKVLILKGRGGRSTLHDKLSRLGASVSLVELYERRVPSYSSAHLNSKLTDFDPDYFIALSGETLTNLVAMFKQCEYDASQKGFILSSNRVANIAIEHGFNLIYVPKNLMPIDIIQCISKAQRK
jgi:uroporphyrinogen-III synthase